MHTAPASPEPSEAEEITALTRRSTGHWGYDREVLDRMREMLAVSAEQIRAGHVVVADRDGVLLGYYPMGGEVS